MIRIVVMLIAYIYISGTIRSGTEEELTDLVRLLADISTYQRDIKRKKQKEMSSKSIGEEMGKEAMESLFRKLIVIYCINIP